jgi:biopolymer transport protein ExbD
MAINVGGGGDERPMSDINTTPLVDVMLVLLIIFLIALPVAIQTVEKLHIPIMVSKESKDKAENLLLTVTTTDAAGHTPALHPTGYQGASRTGECRVYINNTTLVTSDELRDQAFKRLDAIVQRAGGAAAIMKNPDEIPEVLIRADQNAPWRCVAGAIYNVQAAAYPTVGFMSFPKDPNS